MVSLFRAPAKAKTRKQSSNSGAHATRMSPRSKRSRRRNSNSRKPEREAATVSATEPGCDPHCTIFNRSQNPNFNESTLNSVNGNSTTVTYQYNYYISGNLHLSQDGSLHPHSSGVAPTPEENGKKYKQSRHKKHSTY
ncbi:hypothetical protein VKT23_011444 [Stygiomarasmius scandens]|uniref:Uncharacterized protein n=1 Tax=Marasmiellus scandens TaxID=2682957 RepID=A0ABR1J8S7_9AGAR